MTTGDYFIIHCIIELYRYSSEIVLHRRVSAFKKTFGYGNLWSLNIAQKMKVFIKDLLLLLLLLLLSSLLLSYYYYYYYYH